MKMKEIVIRRRMWGRGNTGGFLRNVEGKQCCLGFVCRAFGVPLNAVAGEVMPAQLGAYRASLPKWLLVDSDKADVVKAADINDALDLADDERELKITAIFKKHGLRAVFKP